MPEWVDKWLGGRYYLDERGRKVFIIESNRKGVPRSVQLKTHDEELAKAELAKFRDDPELFCQEPAAKLLPVFITTDRLNAYLASIRECVEDHRNARRSYLLAWATKNLDLRKVERQALRAALASFDGGHAGRTEAINAFCRFLVKEGELPHWNPLVDTHGTKATRAERVAYSLEELHGVYSELKGPMKDLFLMRVCTGMHHTEIEQLQGCQIFNKPLPNKGAAVRKLDGEHEIQGVLQFKHKTKPRHRVSVNRLVLEAALRLREGVPGRISAWKAFEPVVPSNLRHTFETLAEDVGTFVSYTGAGVDRSLVAQVMGHRSNSTMIADRYNKTQVPVMVRIPFP